MCGLQAVLYTLIVYFMVHLEITVGKHTPGMCCCSVWKCLEDDRMTAKKPSTSSISCDHA